MPSLADLRSRYSVPCEPHEESADSEEILVTDSRGNLSPAQMVELKLRSALLSGTLDQAGLVTPDGKRRAAK
jgi:hypothetical protein